MLRIRYEQKGGHVHCRVFMGAPAEALAKCGDLTFRVDEFVDFAAMLSSVTDERVEVEFKPENADRPEPLS